jgi:hypothetical protein
MGMAAEAFVGFAVGEGEDMVDGEFVGCGRGCEEWLLRGWWWWWIDVEVWGSVDVVVWIA